MLWSTSLWRVGAIHVYNHWPTSAEKQDYLLPLAWRLIDIGVYCVWLYVEEVAQTIADLAGEDKNTAAHLAEAIQVRSLDREVMR